MADRRGFIHGITFASGIDAVGTVKRSTNLDRWHLMISGRHKEMLRMVLRLVAPLKPVLEKLAELECRLARAWVRGAHGRLLAIQWYIHPQPENFDHSIDLYYQWQKSRNPQWLERGVFGCLALKGGRVLELACGDGFNARNFYSIRSQSVVACDFDSKAIRTARRKNSAANVEFCLADIRLAMPSGMYDNVVWDAAIEHFTESEIAAILQGIKARLNPNGVLSGYTIVEREDGAKSLETHEHEFKSKEELLLLLSPTFQNVKVFETIYPGRHNLYFWASDGDLPFDSNWMPMTESRQPRSVPREGSFEANASVISN